MIGLYLCLCLFIRLYETREPVINSVEQNEVKAVLTNCLLLFNYFKHFRFALQEHLRQEDLGEFITEEVMTSN